MAFCSKCGSKMDDGVKFCQSCGASASGKTAARQTRSAAGKASASDVEENKTMAIIAYILFFIPLITGDHKKSPYVRFHTNQGTVLFLAAVALSIASTILRIIFSALFRGIGAWALIGLFNMVFSLLWFGPLILCIIGIINAVNGKMEPLPVIGKFEIIK